MSEAVATVERRAVRRIHVEAKSDHLESLARARPITALAELIWNALDADADLVKIGVSDNDLGTPFEIEVLDNGNGIPIGDAELAFGNLGGSWKRNHRLTPTSKKKMHGRDGKGRFKAFALGHEVTWDTVFVDEKDQSQRYTIRGNDTNLQDFDISERRPASAGRSRGTKVLISQISERLGIFSADGSASTQLAEVFALYLRNYPTVRIVFRGERIDPAAVQKSIDTYDLPKFVSIDGKQISAQLDVIEWTFDKKERRICLCDSGGYTLHEVEAGIRPGAEYNFTAFVRSDFIARLHDENALALDELDPDIRHLLDEARNALRMHFRRRKAESASELVQQWKDEGVYPFSGEAVDAVEKARREVFDICALSVHEHLDSFREGVSRDRQFTLRMLSTALDENPEALKRILSEVLDLPKEKQKELADLLQFTTLSAIIEASKMVTERLQFLAGLESLLYSHNTKQAVKERTQLHRMLESETWIFGEEYFMTGSDENLTSVLRKHLAALRPADKLRKRDQAVRRDDGSEGRIDMLLVREVPAYAKPWREYLVVELKRPSVLIDLTVKAQIESYAMAVAADERFDKTNTSWTFLAVSNALTQEASLTVRQPGKPVGFFHKTDNLKIGLASWSEIILASRTRLDAFRAKLNYTATQDHGVALLHDRYRQYLPES